MHRYRIAVSLRIALTAAALAVSGVAPVLAQESTPAAGPATVMLPIAPDPATCTADMAAPAELQAIYDDVHASPASAATPAPFVEPVGEPADAATAAAVTAVVVDVIRCNANGGNGLADAYFLTESHLRESLAEMTAEEFAAYTTPLPLPPEEWLMVYAVRDPRVLPDGRVAANPEIIVPGVGHFRDTLIFAQVEGRWLIDESHEGEPIYLAQ